MQFSSAILQKLGKDTLIQENSVSSSIGGERRNEPPRKLENIVVEIWPYLQEVYTFGAESEIQEILSKNCEKVNFP